MIINCVTAVITICAASILRLALSRLNKQLDRDELSVRPVDAGTALSREARSRGFRFAL